MIFITHIGKIKIFFLFLFQNFTHFNCLWCNENDNFPNNALDLTLYGNLQHQKTKKFNLTMVNAAHRLAINSRKHFFLNQILMQNKFDMFHML